MKSLALFITSMHALLFSWILWYCRQNRWRLLHQNTSASVCERFPDLYSTQAYCVLFLCTKSSVRALKTKITLNQTYMTVNNAEQISELTKVLFLLAQNWSCNQQHRKCKDVNHQHFLPQSKPPVHETDDIKWCINNRNCLFKQEALFYDEQ